ncbi:MAG TPA: hypothetical protein VJU18_17860 [Vicinamibacteria bacterium]|nr:hypothetical protein [Vicinamibacteria bacterium]
MLPRFNEVPARLELRRALGHFRAAMTWDNRVRRDPDFKEGALPTAMPPITNEEPGLGIVPIAFGVKAKDSHESAALCSDGPTDVPSARRIPAAAGVSQENRRRLLRPQCKLDSEQTVRIITAAVCSSPEVIKQGSRFRGDIRGQECGQHDENDVYVIRSDQLGAGRTPGAAWEARTA